MKIEVLIGMIASGKSTYAKSRAKDGALVISHDDLTQMLHAEYRYEQGLREAYRQMEEDLARIAIRASRDVVIDRTHLTFESRRRWIDFAAIACSSIRPVECVAVKFAMRIASVHASSRYDSDSRGRTYEEWLNVAEHHHAQAIAEPLQSNEGFTSIIHA